MTSSRFPALLPERVCRAFTLIELLSVIAVVAILASILLVSISKVRSEAEAVQSVTNLRQIYAAMAMWGNENNNAYFPARARSMSGFGNQYWNWYGTGYSKGNVANGLSPLAGYMGYPTDAETGGHAALNKVTISPQNQRRESLNDRGQEGAYGYPYVANYWVMAHATTGAGMPHTPLDKTALSQPSKIFMLADSAAEGGWGLGVSSTGNVTRIGTLEDGKTTVLWADGHVSRIDPSAIVQENIVPQN